MKYKGIYRLKPELDQETNDFPRDKNGCIAETYDDIFIDCQYGNRIYYYGKLPDSSSVYLWAYIPSVVRGKNIKKQMDDKSIPYFNFFETDTEVTFKFKPKDIDQIADLLRAKTQGADISPFSSKNLPKPDVSIPYENMQAYKEITASIKKDDLFIIRLFTNDFCFKNMAKILRHRDKSFNLKQDIRQQKMGRSIKTYIWSMGFWDEYLVYLRKKIQTYYKNKEKE